MSDERTTVSVRVPKEMRDKLQERAKSEERSEGGFIRYHLNRILDAEEAEAAEQAEAG